MLLFSGCAQNKISHVSNGDEVIFTGPNGVSYTKEELYQTMKVTSDTNIANDILDRIARTIDGFDIREFYVSLVQGLKERGL